MIIGQEEAGKTYVDLLGHRLESLKLDAQGSATFLVKELAG